MVVKRPDHYCGDDLVVVAVHTDFHIECNRIRLGFIYTASSFIAMKYDDNETGKIKIIHQLLCLCRRSIVNYILTRTPTNGGNVGETQRVRKVNTAALLYDNRCNRADRIVLNVARIEKVWVGD